MVGRVGAQHLGLGRGLRLEPLKLEFGLCLEFLDRAANAERPLRMPARVIGGALFIGDDSHFTGGKFSACSSE